MDDPNIPKEFQSVTLAKLANGGLEELFQANLQAVLANIHDPNTPADAKRSITITLAFETDDEKKEIRYGAKVMAKLAGVRGTGGTIYTSDRQHKGKYLALETSLTQMRLDEATNAQAETGLPSRPASVDVPPTQ